MEENKKEVKEQEENKETVKVEKAEEVKQDTKKEETSETKKAANDVKNEAAETVKQVKEKMKDVNFKEEAKAAKGFVTKLASDPIKEIEEIANDEANKNFRTSIILVIAWTIIAILSMISIFFAKYSIFSFGDKMLMLVKTMLAPALMVASMSLVIFLISRKSENKKSLITIITAVTTTFVPVIIAKLLSLLTLISTNISCVTSRLSYIATALTIVMQFFAVKSILGEKENKGAFKKFIIVMALFYVVSLVFYFLGIGMYY